MARFSVLYARGLRHSRPSSGTEAVFKQGGPERYWQKRLEVEGPKTGDTHWKNVAAVHSRLNQKHERLEYSPQAKEKPLTNIGGVINADASFECLREVIDEPWRKK
jgi:hypothetical protein